MKILYGIQGTGNGHVSRARSFIPKLNDIAEIDVLISGSASEMHPGVSVSYQLHGLGFTFGKTGGIDFIDSFKNFRPYTLIKDIRQLSVTAYDLVISDFEPITAWAAKRNQIPCIGLSHQASFLSNRVPRPEKKNLFSEAVLKHYAPCTHPIGFHYREYDHFIYSPIIRKEIRELRNMQTASNSSKREHITVYLPAYKDISLIKRFLQISSVDWHIFSKKASSSFSINNVYIKPVNKTAYEQSLATCRGVICGAGFEAPSEALYLGKPLMVIPMKWQYEQQCNAAALSAMGIPVCTHIDDYWIKKVDSWLNNPTYVQLSFPDPSENILDRIMDISKTTPAIKSPKKPLFKKKSTLRYLPDFQTY